MTHSASITSDRAAAFRTLSCPNRVAVVGAGDDPATFAGGSIFNLVRYGYEGALYPVNPRRDQVQGIPAYPNVASCPTEIDSAVILVRSELVQPALDECAAAGARSAIVVASGFGEGAAGEMGRYQRHSLDTWLDEHDMLILGPSTTGLVNLLDRYVPRAIGNQLAPMYVEPGPIALITQSGASNNVAFNRAQTNGVRVGLAIATGVQANLDVWDCVKEALSDDRLSVVAVIVEQLGAADRWLPVCERAARANKSIVVLRVGRSRVGADAIATHTGSLAGDWTIQRAALKSAGVYLAHDIDHLWELAGFVSRAGTRTRTGPGRLSVMALSGGEGGLIADLADDRGVELPPPEPQFDKVVAEQMRLSRAANPFDPTGEMLSMGEGAKLVMGSFFAQSTFDATLVALNARTGDASSGTLDLILGGSAQSGVPGMLSWWPLVGTDSLRADLLKTGWTLVDGSHRAVNVFGAWCDRTPFEPTAVEWIESARHRVKEALKALGDDLSYYNVRRVLADSGVSSPSIEYVEINDLVEADLLAASVRVGLPVALKANVQSSVHKRNAGALRLGLESPEEVVAAAEDLRRGGYESVAVEPMVSYRAELIVGARFDAQAGASIVVGTGGSNAELFNDVVVIPARVCSAERFRTALESSHGGRNVVDDERAVHQLHRAAILLARLAEGGFESEINPFVVLDSGAVALDARVIPIESNPLLGPA